MSRDYDADSFFDTQPVNLTGAYDRGDTPPRNHTPPRHTPDTLTGVSPDSSPSHTYTKTNSASMAHNKHRDTKKHSDSSYSRTYSEYSDRRRSRSKSYESYTDDDFEESDHSDYGDRRTPRRGTGDRHRGSKGRSLHRAYSGSSTHSTTTSVYGKPSYRPRNKATKRTGRSQSHTGGAKVSPREPDVVAKRMLSARLHTINRLRNDYGDLEQKYDELLRENKLLKTLQRRQDKVINKYEGQENELGDMLSRHNNEVEHLRKKLQKYKHDNLDKDRRLRDQNDEVLKTQSALKRMKAIVKDKNLLERDELSRKLGDTQDELEEKKTRVQELEKYIENLKKNHRVEINEIKAKQRESEHQLEELQHEHAKLKITLKEKEKELDIKNIYSNRVIRASTKLSNSLSTTPMPTPRKVRTANKAVQAVDISEFNKPPTKTKEEVSPRDVLPQEDSFEKQLQRQRDLERQQEEDRRRLEEDEKKRKEQEEAARILRELDFGGLHRETSADRKRREEEEELARERERRRKQDAEAKKAKEEQERREIEERERREREERERREREQKEKEEAERREQERLEEQERERIDQEEREKQAKIDEDRRKKDLLLARLRDIDAGKNPPPDSPEESRKNYNFSDPIVNLHNGLPSHPPDEAKNSAKKKKKKSLEGNDGFAVGGYAPSFGRRVHAKPQKKSDWLFDEDNSEKKSPTPEKKSNLMSDLFGNTPDDKPRASLGDDIFTTSTKAKPVADKNAYPWEKGVDVATARGGRRATNNLFSDDDDENDKLLPRRPRHNNNTMYDAKPAVNAIDDFDDDIEEVIL
ncbi:uncharacterized protein LOC100372739 isoform X2 [Saccoglossus kowalevskii]